MPAKQNPSTIDAKALAKGLGQLKPDGKSGYHRIVVDGRTLAYVKRHAVTVRAAAVAKAPKRLATFTIEKNGRWANAAVKDTDQARRVLEYVAGRVQA